MIAYNMMDVEMERPAQKSPPKNIATGTV